MISLSIDRTALGLGPLVFSSPDTGLWLNEEGLSRPAKTQRRTYAGESKWVNGSTLVSSVLEQSSLPFTGYAQAATQAELVAMQDEVEEALFQWAYDVTVTENGVARTWACDPADVSWGDFDSGMSAALMVRATVTIPVYPIAVA